MNKLMECFYCKGRMTKGETSYVVNRKGYHLVLDKVPAYVCSQCGEPYFEAHEVALVQEMIKEIDQKAQALHVFDKPFSSALESGIK